MRQIIAIAKKNVKLSLYNEYMDNVMDNKFKVKRGQVILGEYVDSYKRISKYFFIPSRELTLLKTNGFLIKIDSRYFNVITDPKRITNCIYGIVGNSSYGRFGEYGIYTNLITGQVPPSKKYCKKYYDDAITTQLSGLTDYELSLEKIIDEIKDEKSTLLCIGILRNFIKEGCYSTDEMIKWLIDVYGLIDNEPEEAKSQLNYFINKLKEIKL